MKGCQLLRAHPAYEVGRLHVREEIHPARAVTLVAEADFSEVERIRRRAPRLEDRPTYTAFVIKALARALKDFPYANRRLVTRPWLPFGRLRLQQFSRADIAVACERDLPGIENAVHMDVLRSADRSSLAEVTRWLRDLAACDATNSRQWRQFAWMITHLPPRLSAWLMRLQEVLPGWWERYRGAAALVSSPGKYGADEILATWPWPIGLSFGVVKERPVVREGRVVPLPTCRLSLSFDRRNMAGAPGARFFAAVVRNLEQFTETDMGPSPLAECHGGRTGGAAPDGDACRADGLEGPCPAQDHASVRVARELVICREDWDAAGFRH